MKNLSEHTLNFLQKFNGMILSAERYTKKGKWHAVNTNSRKSICIGARNKTAIETKETEWNEITCISCLETLADLRMQWEIIQHTKTRS